MDGLGEAPVYHSTPLHSDESNPYAKDANRDVAAAPQTPQLGGAQANFGGQS